ncbi:DNA alkylation repair protein [Streptomyces sp. NPDC054949]
MTHDPEAFVTSVRQALRELGDPSYVAGTVAARSPGKPVLGIRIPLLRGAVRAGLKAHEGDDCSVREAADALWHGAFHEEELAACMLLRLGRVQVEAVTVRRWADALDNWLSVDELAGCVGESVAALPGRLAELDFLAVSPSPWQRRLYLASLIRPVREGLDPSRVPRLPELLCDRRKPVHMAAAWLVRSVLKSRPAAAEQFAAAWTADVPRSLTRLLEQAKAV